MASLNSSIQLLFFVSGITVIAVITPHTQECYKYYWQKVDEAPPNYEFPKFSDFKLTLYLAIFFTVSEIIARYYFVNIFIPICKE